MPEAFTLHFFLTGLIFVWSGFVRSGLGFGGAALTLPILLLVFDDPLFWLPILAVQLLIFSSLTLYNRLDNVDWNYLKKALLIMIIPKIAGVLGLLNFPNGVLLFMIYTITFIYGVTYVFNYTLKSNNRYVDRVLLVLGAYASGTSLIGAPLISAVFSRHVELTRLRDTLFVVWIILVFLKMTTFIAFDVELHLLAMLYLLPFAAVGHFLGLKAHAYLIQGQGGRFKVIMGIILVAVSGHGLLFRAFA